MFSAKMFNKFTVLLAVIFFLSAIISTISDIQYESNVRMEFSQLVEEANLFNNEHITEVEEYVSSMPTSNVAYETAETAILGAYNNYENANSYYSEISGTLYITNVEGIKLNVGFNINIKNILYPNGDFLQEIIVGEIGTFFGGKSAGMAFFYDAETDLIYRNFTGIAVQKLDSVSFTSSWTSQPSQSYIDKFGAPLTQSIYDVNRKTIVRELFFQKVFGANGTTKEYHVQYELNPVLSTKLYLSFITNILDLVEKDFVKSLRFQSLVVSAIIDENGNLKLAKYKEKYDFTVYVRMWGIQLTATALSNMNYLFCSFNEEITYPKPQI